MRVVSAHVSCSRNFGCKVHETRSFRHRQSVHICSQHNTRLTVTYGCNYACRFSHIRKACRHEFLPESIVYRTSADFGFYTHRYPALFYRLGVGPDAGKTHTSTFSPDERAITTGIAFMKALALKLLNEK